MLTEQQRQILTAKITAALDERQRARPSKPEDNPLHQHDLKRLANAGFTKNADRYPALNMAQKTNDTDGLAFQMEAARVEATANAKADKSARRMAQARARAERKAQFDKIVDLPVVPSPERMTEAWYVVFPLVPIVQRIANGKQAWAARFLGSLADDIGQIALEKMALILAKSDRDLTVLRKAAEELGDIERRTGKTPGDQLTDDERKERSKIAKGRKWLMGMANNRVMGALVDAYTSKRNLRWENIDQIATIMASINGAGDDPMIARTKADRAPAFLGTRFPAPGGIDAGLLAASIAAGITERGLDPLVELLIDTDNLRTDGAFKWADNAEQVFQLTPSADGAHLWTLVQSATEGLAVPTRARADAARTHVRRLFEWLPEHIVATVEAFDFHQDCYNAESHTWSLASTFEQYVPETGMRREVGRPALGFVSTEQAARALVEHLSLLVTGQDYAASIAFA